MNARRGLRRNLVSAEFALERLRDTWAGSLPQSQACDQVVREVEAALKTARELAALAHANASRHHGEATRTEFDGALRSWRHRG